MPAFVREGGVHRQACFGVDAWFGSGGLKNGQEQILALRMGYSAGGFTLLAAYATFGVYKDGFHPQIPFSKPRERDENSSDVFPKHLLSGNLFPPIFLE